MPTVDITGLNFFMPVISFLLVVLVVYAILLKIKILGEHKFFNLFVSFLMGVIFISFSSLELYLESVTPWFVTLFILVFFILLIAGFAGGGTDWIMNKWFGLAVVIILVIIFLVAGIRIFNPIFHPDLGIASGSGTSIIEQIKDFLWTGKVIGSLSLLIIAGLVAWFVTR